MFCSLLVVTVITFIPCQSQNGQAYSKRQGCAAQAVGASQWFREHRRHLPIALSEQALFLPGMAVAYAAAAAGQVLRSTQPGRSRMRDPATACDV
jgi:hypothetical protein